MSRRTAPLAILLLLGGLARAEAPQAALAIPATFSQGGTASAPWLEARPGGRPSGTPPWMP